MGGWCLQIQKLTVTAWPSLEYDEQIRTMFAACRNPAAYPGYLWKDSRHVCWIHGRCFEWTENAVSGRMDQCRSLDATPPCSDSYSTSATIGVGNI